jgi:hypothetical protein
LKRACKNYKDLLDFEAVVDHAVRRERLEELTGEDRAKFYDVLEEFDKLQDLLAKFLKSKAYDDFKVWSRGMEELIKWVGKERVSVGYCGLWERGREYWLMDIPLEYELPFEKTVKDLFEVYRVGYLMPVPTQEEAERTLLDFLEYVKKWDRLRLWWLIKNVYPLSDETGGFYSVVKNVLALEWMRTAWEKVIDKWTGEAEKELKAMPQYEVLKKILVDPWQAERYVTDLIGDVKKEFIERYGNTVEEPEEVKKLFLTAVKESFKERVAPEERISEIYEEIKPLIPADKVELTRGGLLQAIRWATLHPQLSDENFASAHIFPLTFTTEQAREIASRIMAKVRGVPTPPKLLSKEEFFVKAEEILKNRLARYITLLTPGFRGELHYEVPELEEETVKRFTVETAYELFREEIEKEKTDAYETYAKISRPEVFLERFVPDRLDTFARKLADKLKQRLFEEAKAKAKPPPPPAPELVEEPPIKAKVHVLVDAYEELKPTEAQYFVEFQHLVSGPWGDYFHVGAVGFMDTKSLEEFLAKGTETLDVPEDLLMSIGDPEEIKRVLSENPPPFNRFAKYVLTWSPEDVEWSPRAASYRDIYHKAYTEWELKGLEPEDLRKICIIKGVKVGKTKEEMIANILGLPPPAPPAVAPPPKPPPKAPPPAVPAVPPAKRKLTKEEVRKLRDRFVIALRDKGISADKYMPDFRVQIEEKEFGSFEEAEKAVEELVEHISVVLEAGKPDRLRAPPVTRPEEAIGIRLEEFTFKPTKEEMERWQREIEPPEVERRIKVEGETKLRELDMFKDWLVEELGISLTEFAKLPEYTQKLMYAAWRRERKLI